MSYFFITAEEAHKDRRGIRRRTSTKDGRRYAITRFFRELKFLKDCSLCLRCNIRFAGIVDVTTPLAEGALSLRGCREQGIRIPLAQWAC